MLGTRDGLAVGHTGVGRGAIWADSPEFFIIIFFFPYNGLTGWPTKVVHQRPY